jgi:hypothetical protein
MHATPTGGKNSVPLVSASLGHILSLFVKSKATCSCDSKSKALNKDEAAMKDDSLTKKKLHSDEENTELAIVSDLMWSVSLN